MNDSGINVVAFPTPRGLSSHTETFEDYVYWFVETNQGEGFAASILTGYKTIMILPETRG
jgi:hypothetical protein